MDTVAEPTAASNETPVPTPKDFYLALADASKAEKNRVEHVVDTLIHNHRVFETIDQRLKTEIELIKQCKYQNGWQRLSVSFKDIGDILPDSTTGREIITQLKNRYRGFNISISTNSFESMTTPFNLPRPLVIVFRLP